MRDRLGEREPRLAGISSETTNKEVSVQLDRIKILVVADEPTRFLVEEITVNDENIELIARSDSALRLMAGRGDPTEDKEKAERVKRSACSPTIVVDWLPNGACSGRIKSGFVIDLDKARKRLRGRHLEPAGPPPITQTLALADELRDLLATESVNQSQLARRFGLSRARVSQILRLHHLHPAIQDYLRNLRGVGPRYLTERRLRPISYLAPDEQLAELGMTSEITVNHAAMPA
jgi:hypothetical protein